MPVGTVYMTPGNRQSLLTKNKGTSAQVEIAKVEIAKVIIKIRTRVN